MIRDIRLHPSLGYISNATFRDADVLLRWLKPFPQIPVGESWPAEDCRDKRFFTILTLDDLKVHCRLYMLDEMYRGAARGQRVWR